MLGQLNRLPRPMGFVGCCEGAGISGLAASHACESHAKGGWHKHLMCEMCASSIDAPILAVSLQVPMGKLTLTASAMLQGSGRKRLLAGASFGIGGRLDD